ncbi:hypothetical protein V8954_23570 [Klebsiella michiganensis]|uniref:hypothetical protein n=1 Tax=Klebsiella michiganensis TaxID=1134687 RepID=UPI0030CE71D6
MARTKSQPAELIPDVTLNPELEATQNLMATVSSQMNDERDLLNQLLGQAQMADAFAQFSLTVSTSKMAYVKENKLYRALSGRKTADGQQFSGTWDEFCSLLGRSRQQIDEDILNLRTLGEEALESMSRMGIGYRELRQFRRLPEDQKSALIEVAKEGDKTALLELAEEMIAKHAREKEELKTDLEISRQMLAEKKKNSARCAMKKRNSNPAWFAAPPLKHRTKKAWRLRQRSPALKAGFSARSLTLKAASTR